MDRTIGKRLDDLAPLYAAWVTPETRNEMSWDEVVATADTLIATLQDFNHALAGALDVAIVHGLLNGVPIGAVEYALEIPVARERLEADGYIARGAYTPKSHPVVPATATTRFTEHLAKWAEDKGWEPSALVLEAATEPLPSRAYLEGIVANSLDPRETAVAARALTRSFGERLMLIVSEISEALEEYRKWGDDALTIRSIYFDGDKPEGAAIELADAVIRIMQTFAVYGWNLDHALEIKQTYNLTRQHRHGGKAL